MFKKINLSLLVLCFLLLGCNKNLTEEEKKELWSKAQTTGEIINRSGTTFNPDADKDRALADANNRLMSGGGLFGKDGGLVFGDGAKKKKQTSAMIGMPINPYLWRASIETINFMPLSSTDPFAGTIITDWYTSETNMGERCKLNVFINGQELKTSNLKVSSFCQILKDNQWVNVKSNQDDNINLENAILNKAKKLKLSSG
jgi:hypothetical protein